MPFQPDVQNLSFTPDTSIKQQPKGFLQGLNEGVVKPVIETVVKPVVQTLAEPLLKGGATIAELPAALSYNKALDNFHRNPTKENLDNVQLEQNALLFLREGVDFGFFGKAIPAKTEREALGTGIGLGATIAPISKAGPILKGITRGKIVEPILTGIKGGAQGGLISGVGEQIGKENIPSEERALSVGLQTVGGALAGGITAGVGVGLGKIISGAFKIKPNIDPIIDESISKAIRPSVTAKKSAPLYAKYQENARSAVKAIAENSDNLSFVDSEGRTIIGELPKTLKQFSDSISQTKNYIFKQYDEIAKKAGQQGAVVDTKKLANELLKITDDPKFAVIEDQNPSIVKYILDKASILEKRGQYTTEQTQAAIKSYNDALESFYKNPSYDSAAKVTIDAMVVNNFRKELDNVIEKTTGKEYQLLKRLYGSFKAIEGDVNHRMIIDSRKNVKGLIDFTDILSGGQVINGILSMNPAQIAQGATQKLISAAYKKLNDPNRIIEKMFQQVGRQ